MEKKVVFYTKKNCKLCDDVYEMLELLQHNHDFMIEQRDIYTNDQWLEKYHLVIPVVEVDGIELHYEQIDYHSLSELLTNNQ